MGPAEDDPPTGRRKRPACTKENVMIDVPTKRAEAKSAPSTTTPVTKPAVTRKAKPAPKPKVKKAAKPSARVKINAKYTAAKLALQKRLKIGATVTYSGRVKKLDGQKVKIVGYEGRGGVFVEHKGQKFVVSPAALLPKARAKEVTKESAT
jgi:hypothetical protein